VNVVGVGVTGGELGGERAVVGDAAAVHHQRTVDHVGQRTHLMGDDEHRDATVPQAGDRAGEGLLAGSVDSGCRLVHDHDVGLGSQCPGDQHPPLLSTGQRVEVAAGVMGEIDRLDGVIDDLVVQPAQRSDQPPAGEAPGGDDLTDGCRYRPTDGVALRHVADAGPVGARSRTRPEHDHLAVQHSCQAEQPAYQGRLA
jgi:hypothetical protein